MNGTIIWSNGYNEYFDEYCQNAYDMYLEDPEFSPYGDDGEAYRDFDDFKETNFESLWQLYQEDVIDIEWDEIANMIEKQVNNYLYAVGTDTLWHGSYDGYKQIKYENALQPYDIDSRADEMDIVDRGGNVWVNTYNHDGGMSAGLYTDSADIYETLYNTFGEEIDDIAEVYRPIFQLYSYTNVTLNDAKQWIIDDIHDYIFDGDISNQGIYTDNAIEEFVSKHGLTLRDLLVPIKVQW